jgi:hypothetical protein
MTPNAISVIVNSPSFEHELAIRRNKMDEIVDNQIVDSTDEITRQIQEGARDAVRRLLGGIKSEDEAIAIKSSTEVLDRAGFPRVNKIESKNVNVNISSEDAARIAETISLDKD